MAIDEYYNLTEAELHSRQKQLYDMRKGILFEIERNDAMRAKRSGEMSAYYDGKAAAWFSMLEWIDNHIERMQIVRIVRQRNDGMD